MNYKEYREDFTKDLSDSIKRSYTLLFKKIDKYEKENKLIFEEFTEEQFVEFTRKELIGKSANSTVVKVSLLKKYVESLNKYFIKITRKEIIRMTDEKLEQEKKVEDENDLKYISWEELKKELNRVENDVDKAILCLLRMGISGSQFKELVNLKVENIDIKNKLIHLDNRDVEIEDDYIINILENAIEQRTYYVLSHKDEGEGKITEYDFNMDCPYLLKQRPTVKNNGGMNPYKFGGISGKMFRIFQELGLDISAINLLQSYAADKIVERENLINKRMSTKDVKAYFKEIKCSQNAYDSRILSIWVRQNYNR